MAPPQGPVFDFHIHYPAAPLQTYICLCRHAKEACLHSSQPAGRMLPALDITHADYERARSAGPALPPPAAPQLEQEHIARTSCHLCREALSWSSRCRQARQPRVATNHHSGSNRGSPCQRLDQPGKANITSVSLVSPPSQRKTEILHIYPYAEMKT